MMSNVINFPCLVATADGVHYGGRVFSSLEELRDWMPDKEWRRRVAWESRHAAYLERRYGRCGEKREGGAA
jgi:hypothetical protein